MAVTINVDGPAAIEAAGLGPRLDSADPTLVDLVSSDPEFVGTQAPWTDLELVGLAPTVVSASGEASHYVDWNTGENADADQRGYHHVDWNTGLDLYEVPDAYEYAFLNAGFDYEPQPLTGHYVYLNGVDTQPQPALFWLAPNFGREGAEFVATGIGLGADQTTYDGVILMSGTICGLIDWEFFPPDHAEGEQFINFEAATTNMEHIVVTVSVPSGLLVGGQPVQARTEEQP